MPLAQWAVGTFYACKKKAEAATILPARSSRLADNPMPQIDFGQAFSIPDEEGVPPASESDPSLGAEPVQSTLTENKRARFPVCGRLSQSGWANIIFAGVTFVGGLFSAFFFFNGSDLLRAAAAWSGEFLYSPPTVIAQSGELNPVGDQAFPSGPNSAGSSDRSGDPFSRSTGFLSLASPSNIASSGAGAGLPSTATAPVAGSLLPQLGFSAPGGDALLQAFNRGVADLARASNLDAHRTVIVVQTAVTQVDKHSTAKARNAIQRGQNGVVSATGQQATQATTPQSSQMVGSAQNQGAAATTSTVNSNSVNNATQSTMNSVRGTTSNPGAGLGSALDRGPVSLGGHH
jgi:hypothetical protein